MYRWCLAVLLALPSTAAAHTAAGDGATGDGFVSGIVLSSPALASTPDETVRTAVRGLLGRDGQIDAIECAEAPCLVRVRIWNQDGVHRFIARWNADPRRPALHPLDVRPGAREATVLTFSVGADGEVAQQRSRNHQRFLHGQERQGNAAPRASGR